MKSAIRTTILNLPAIGLMAASVYLAIQGTEPNVFGWFLAAGVLTMYCVNATD